MRFLLLAVIVGGISVAALVRPIIGLYGYLWFALMRPDALAWAEGQYKLSFILAAATLAGSIPRILPKLGVFLGNSTLRLVLLLQIPFVLSAIFAYDSQSALSALGFYARVLVMALLIPVLIEALPNLRQLLLVMGVSVCLLGAKFGLFGLRHGGVRYDEGYGGMMSDNNTLALAIAMGIPLCWYGREMISRRWAKMACLGLVFLSIAAVVMTHSRGAALALGAAFLMVIIRSRRKIGLLIVLTALCLPALVLMGESYFDRLSTIASPEEEASAQSRIVLTKTGFLIGFHNPLLGVGFGTTSQQQLLRNYLPEEHQDYGVKVLHNTYAQVFADSGLLALILHCVVLFGTIIWLERSIRRTRRDSPGLEVYPIAIQTSLVVFAIGSTFLSRVTFDFYYFMLMAAVVWRELEQRPAPVAVVQQDTPAGRVMKSTRPDLPGPVTRPRPGFSR